MGQPEARQTRPLSCWGKARELRENHYRRYAQEGLLRCAGGGWAFDSLLAGLGDDVVFLAGEPYGASVAYDRA
ncbi:MAG: benzoyl-CoA reductase, bzd-type, subunit O, partial [Dehalococcoidia bacterium]|nr:benzoyl-CoA reductase, bzd-type, subunit O [Dehalococcoidia bacterium]